MHLQVDGPHTLARSMGPYTLAELEFYVKGWATSGVEGEFRARIEITLIRRSGLGARGKLV